jgi:hypothetical protein
MPKAEKKLGKTAILVCTLLIFSSSLLNAHECSQEMRVAVPMHMNLLSARSVPLKNNESSNAQELHHRSAERDKAKEEPDGEFEHSEHTEHEEEEEEMSEKEEREEEEDEEKKRKRILKNRSSKD